MNIEGLTLRLNEIELAAPPGDNATEHNTGTAGVFDTFVRPTLENPLPTVGISLALAALAVAGHRALHHKPKPWLEDR